MAQLGRVKGGNSHLTLVSTDDTIARVSKHQKTLEAIFAEPVKGSILWRDAESLLIHKGATIQQGAGSRVRVALHGRKAVFHRPHPSPNMKKSLVRSVRDFLERAGVTP